MNVKERLADYAEMTEEALEKYLPMTECLQKRVIEAARYSLLAGDTDVAKPATESPTGCRRPKAGGDTDVAKPATESPTGCRRPKAGGGKRLRPALVMEFCRVCGEEPETALPVACAIEMLHTFSLIHDDLPCMDDDDMRRGKPSCHKAFGEDIAVLAGDALAMLPYQIIAEAGLKKTLSKDTALRLISLLGELSGVFGMIGGQTLDLENSQSSGKQAEVPTILEMYRMKTGALLEFSCRAGCITAGASADKLLAAGVFGQRLGLAFQIIDDILDLTADEKLLGKPVGSDLAEGKRTYVAAVGLEKARERAAALTAQAKEALSAFTDNEFLVELTEMLLNRAY